MAPKKQSKSTVNASVVESLNDRDHILAASAMYLPSCAYLPYVGYFLGRTGNIDRRTTKVNKGLIHLLLEIISNAADNGSTNGLITTFTQQVAAANGKNVENLCRQSPARILVEVTPQYMAVENYGAPFNIDFLSRNGQQHLIPYACFAFSKVGSNFDKTKPRLGIGRYGQGAKTVPAGSVEFILECVDSIRNRYYRLEWRNNGDPNSIRQIVWPEPLQGPNGYYIPDVPTTTPSQDIMDKIRRGSYTRVQWRPDMEIGDLNADHIGQFGQMISPGDVIRIRRYVAGETEEYVGNAISAGVDPQVQIDGSVVRTSSISNIRYLRNESRKTSVPESQLFFHGSTSITDDEIDLTGRYAKDLTLCGVPIILRRMWSDGTSAEHVLAPITVADYGRLIFGPSVNVHYHSWASNDNKSPVQCSVAYFDTPGTGDRIGFVNGVCTSNSGMHITAAMNALFEPLKTDPTLVKAVPNVDAHDFKRHITMIVTAIGTDPMQRGQTKEGLDELSGRKSFTITKVDADTVQQIVKTWKAVKSVIASATELERAAEIEDLRLKLSKKKPVVAYIPANAFGPNSTLVLTEGDSCTNYAEVMKNVHPLSDNIGILSMRGVPANLYESDLVRLLKSQLFTNIIRVMNMDPQKSYNTDAEIATLKYGKIIMMGDPDLDGFHIISLMISNFVHYWPFLFHQRRVGVLRTPVVRIWSNDGSRILARYYSDKEYDLAVEQRSSSDPAIRAAAAPVGDVKRIKGLGSVKIGVLDNPGIELLDDVQNAPVIWFYMDSEGIAAIDTFFIKSRTDARKKAITHFAGICEDTMSACTVDTQTNVISMGNMPLMRRGVENYIYRELVQYSIGSLKRHIPYERDGLKDVQRKIIAWWLKHTRFGETKSRNKVEEMAGKVSSEFDYHHGPASLGGAIKRMAITGFPGANNVSPLIPESAMGSRLNWPSDCPQSRYAYVGGAKWLKHAINKYVYSSIPKMKSDDMEIEPRWIPAAIPYSIMNGVFGVATGWRTYIPAMHPTSTMNFLMELVSADVEYRHPVTEPILFWYCGFRGTMEIVRGVKTYLRSVDYIDTSDTKPHEYNDDVPETAEHAVVHERSPNVRSHKSKIAPSSNAISNATMIGPFGNILDGTVPCGTVDPSQTVYAIDEMFDEDDPSAREGGNQYEVEIYAERAIEFSGIYELLDPAQIKDNVKRDLNKIVRVLHITEVPPETRLVRLNYIIANLMDEGLIHSYTSSTKKGISYFLNLTILGVESYAKGNLIAQLQLKIAYPLTNFFFLNDYGAPVKFECIEDYLRRFYAITIESYAMGIARQIADLGEKRDDLNQQWMYIDACLKGRIVIGSMRRSEIDVIIREMSLKIENVKKVNGYDINDDGRIDREAKIIEIDRKIAELKTLRPCQLYYNDLKQLIPHVPTCPMPVKIGLCKWKSGEK